MVAAASPSLTKTETSTPSAITAAATRNATWYPARSSALAPVTPRIVPSSATPTAAPACRTVFCRVEACPVSAAEILAMLAASDGAIANPNESPVKNISSGISQSASDRPASAIAPIVSTVPDMPAIIRRRGPTRL
jgi:hypothetical protein